MKITIACTFLVIAIGSHILLVAAAAVDANDEAASNAQKQPQVATRDAPAQDLANTLAASPPVRTPREVTNALLVLLIHTIENSNKECLPCPAKKPAGGSSGRLLDPDNLKNLLSTVTHALASIGL